MTQMNSVVHFEMPYDDRERMAKFYQDLPSGRGFFSTDTPGAVLVVAASRRP